MVKLRAGRHLFRILCVLQWFVLMLFSRQRRASNEEHTSEPGASVGGVAHCPRTFSLFGFLGHVRLSDVEGPITNTPKLPGHLWLLKANENGKLQKANKRRIFKRLPQLSAVSGLSV